MPQNENRWDASLAAGRRRPVSALPHCIRLRRDCQFHSAPFIPRHVISSLSHEPGSGNMGNSEQMVGNPDVNARYGSLPSGASRDRNG
jgi:hypothetical protein